MGGYRATPTVLMCITYCLYWMIVTSIMMWRYKQGTLFSRFGSVQGENPFALDSGKESMTKPGPSSQQNPVMGGTPMQPPMGMLGMVPTGMQPPMMGSMPVPYGGMPMGMQPPMMGGMPVHYGGMPGPYTGVPIIGSAFGSV